MPGDQVEALRAALRTELRRLKLRGRTYVQDKVVFVVSDDAFSAEKHDAIHRTAVESLDYLTRNRTSQEQFGIRWDTWGSA